MANEWTVTVTDPQRAAEWQAMLGTTTVHVRSPLPTWASVPGRDHTLVYWLDLDALTPEQKQALVDHISRKFKVAADEVAADFARDPAHAMPILAEDCIAPAIPLRLLI